MPQDLTKDKEQNPILYDDGAGSEFDLELAMQEEDDSQSELRETAEAVLKSLEIAEQKGVKVEGDRKKIPGRVALMPITLIQTLSASIGFSLAVVLFSKLASQYLLPLAATQIILFSQIALYHSSYRALRKALALFHALFTVAFTVFLDWALIDRIKNFHHSESLTFLYLAVIAFSLVPAFMIAHWAYLGRSYRLVKA